MATAQLTITIDRPVAEVFAYVVDIGRLHEWVEVIQAARPAAGEPGQVGSTYIVQARFMGREMEIPSEVVGYEQDRRYAYRSTGWMTYVDTMTFEPTKTGTRVTEQIVMASEGRLAPLRDRLKLALSRRSHQQNLAQLKQRLEGAAAAVAAG